MPTSQLGQTAELKCVQEKLWLAKESSGMKAHPHRDDDRSPVPGCPCSRRLPKDVSSGFEENYQGKYSDRPSGSTETIPEVLCLRQCYSLLFVCHLIRADNRMQAITSEAGCSPGNLLGLSSTSPFFIGRAFVQGPFASPAFIVL